MAQHPSISGYLSPPTLRRALALLFAALQLAHAASAQDEGGPTALELSQPLERELRAGQKHVYLIEVAAGQYLQLSVEQLGADASAP